MTPIRSRVYWADLGYGRKPFLCVSNNARNRSLDTFLAVRITTSHKQALDSIVRLGPADRPLVGNVLCDDLVQLYGDEILADGGAVSLATMMLVGQGLRAALALL